MHTGDSDENVKMHEEGNSQRFEVPRFNVLLDI